MKKIVFFILLVLGACQYIDVPEPDFNQPVDELQPVVTLKSGVGYSSSLGQIFAPLGFHSLFFLESELIDLDKEKIVWKVEGSEYVGKAIVHKFASLGESEILITIGKQKFTYEIMVVSDLSEGDPVVMFPGKSAHGEVEVLVLFKRERLRYAEEPFYLVGDHTDWKKVKVTLSDYDIEQGDPVRGTSSSQYLGTTITVADEMNYSFALVHSGDQWADFSGSAYVRENPGLLFLAVSKGKVKPLGTAQLSLLPGDTGDSYIRFDIDYVYIKTAKGVAVKSDAGDYVQAKLTSMVDYPGWVRLKSPSGSEHFFRFDEMEESSLYDGLVNAVHVYKQGL